MGLLSDARTSRGQFPSGALTCSGHGPGGPVLSRAAAEIFGARRARKDQSISTMECSVPRIPIRPATEDAGEQGGDGVRWAVSAVWCGLILVQPD